MHETCLEYFRRRLSEGWKCINLEGYKVLLLSPEGIRRELDLRNDVETLRPNASGSEEHLNWTCGCSKGSHWQCVDDTGSGDGISTAVGVAMSAYLRDLYNIPNHSEGSGTINKVTLYYRVRSETTGSGVKGAIRSNSTVTETPEKFPKVDFGDGTWGTYNYKWTTNPAGGDWTWDDIDALQIGIALEEGSKINVTMCTQVYVEIDYTPAPPVVIPTVTTQAASSIGATTATGHGNVTNNGGENPDDRRIEWGTSSGNYSGGSCSAGGGGTGAFSCGLTGLPTGTTIYCRAKAHNSAGWGYGGQVTFLTKPAAPTSVAATDGEHTDKVVITWVKSTGATGYQVYRNGTPLGWLGNVATYDDTGAGAPTITPGAADASDGLHTTHVALSLSGHGTNNGATHTYKVRAKNATGESVDSGTNTGYRGVGSLTYQWQRSDADSDADYNTDIGTTEAYDDTGAPANGDGRYYRCVENATGAAEQTSSSDRGYRVGETTYNTMVGSPTGWVWEKCDYEVSEKCPVGSETSWAWGVPTLSGPDKTPQGSPTSFSWGSE